MSDIPNTGTDDIPDPNTNDSEVEATRGDRPRELKPERPQERETGREDRVTERDATVDLTDEMDVDITERDGPDLERDPRW